MEYEKDEMAATRDYEGDGYYVAYKLIILPYISFMFIEMKFVYCHSCVIFVIKSMTICND